MPVELYIVRLWDGMDGTWIDITGPVPEAEASRIYDEKTANGTVKTTFEDIDYYRIFSADTEMIYSEGLEMFR